MKLLIAVLVLLPVLAQADSITGKLESSGKENQFKLTVQNSDGIRAIPLVFPNEEIQHAVATLAGKASYVTVQGQWTGPQDALSVSRVPTITSGDQTLRGKLTTNGSGEYEIGGVPVKFGDTKVVNGASFDQKSRDYFTGKDVVANGTFDRDHFVIQSVIRGGIFSASPVPHIEDSTFANEFFNDPLTFTHQLLREKVRSPSPAWFRGTLISNPQNQVKPGDSVMIITASGREGDSMGAVNGHFSVGAGRVGTDLEIQGELFNVYVTNEKQIVPGDVEMVSYYGHLISGQNNYRPTYTLILYGISPDKVEHIRNQLDRFHPFFRAGNTKITCSVNCTTLSVQAMADEGIYGPQRVGTNGTPPFPLLSNQDKLPAPLSELGAIKYIHNTPKSEFMPGPAFDALLSNLLNLNSKTDLGITRADFIFGGQTPSGRPVGGPPTMSITNNITDQFEIGVKLGVAKIEKDLKADLAGCVHRVGEI